MNWIIFKRYDLEAGFPATGILESTPGAVGIWVELEEREGSEFAGPSEKELGQAYGEGLYVCVSRSFRSTNYAIASRVAKTVEFIAGDGDDFLAPPLAPGPELPEESELHEPERDASV